MFNILFLCSVIFYKYLSYAIKFLWIFKFIMIIITLAYANWQQWVPQADMLHVSWRIQIFCIWGTTIANYARFFISNKIMQLSFYEYFSSLSFFWLLCIWGPGSPRDSVSFFIRNRFMQLNLYEYLSLLYYFGLCNLATMRPLGRHLPCVVDNTDTLYLGD